MVADATKEGAMPDPVTPVPVASAPPEPPAAPPTPPTPDPVTPPEADLGEAGKKALAAERTARQVAERAANEARAELEKLKAAAMSDSEKAIAAAKAEGRNEALTGIKRGVLTAEVRAAAAGRLNDPADAVRLLDLDKFTVGDDGTVDTAGIASAIEALVKDKPYLAVSPGSTTPPKPAGNVDGGPRGGTGPKVTRDQLKTMTPQQIAALPKADVHAALTAP